MTRRLDGVAHNLKLVDGRYSAVATVTLNDADLPSPAEFICTLWIPQAKYAVRKEAIYYPGNCRYCDFVCIFRNLEECVKFRKTLSDVFNNLLNFKIIIIYFN